LIEEVKIGGRIESNNKPPLQSMGEECYPSFLIGLNEKSA